VRCLWTGTGSVSTIVPDGCLDLIVTGDRVFVAGPDTAPWLSELPSGQKIHGVRFRPGNAPRVLGVAADELLDQRVSLAELWGREGREATELLLADPAALTAVVARRPRPDVDADVERLVARLRGGATRVSDALAGLEVGERQLRRRFTAAVGYGPATFLRVSRLQRAIERAGTATDLAALAYDSGYADHAHLSRDCRDLTGAPPREFFAPMTVPFKPARSRAS